MLVLSRKRDEAIVITAGEHTVVITVVDVRGDKVRLGVQAPREVIVDRSEIHEKKEAEKHALRTDHPAATDPGT